MLPGVLCNTESMYFKINQSQKKSPEPLAGRQCLRVIFQIQLGSALCKDSLWSAKASFADVV